MKKFYAKFFKDVSYWNTKEGAGVKVDGTRDDSRWSIDVSGFNGVINPVVEGFEDRSITQTILDFIMDTMFLQQDPEENWFSIMDDGRISFSIIEDGNGNHVVKEDQFDGQLYICDYDIMLEVHEVHVPTKEELGELLPNAERGY